MPYCKESILTYLKELNISSKVYTHPPVATCELHTQALSQLGADCTGQAKNLFFKAPSGAGKMKNRLFLVSALVNTTVDTKELSKRMGIKASAPLRFGNDDLFDTLLQVPKGSVTPLCMANESTNEIVLLLDEEFRKHPQCIFHPMTNEASIVLSPQDLDLFAQKACPGRFMWVDFSQTSPLEVAEIGATPVTKEEAVTKQERSPKAKSPKKRDVSPKNPTKEQLFAEDQFFTITAWEDGPFVTAHQGWLKTH